MQNRDKIRVSYLITTRNRAQYLQRTLDNVREFITPEDELIVIDGGSTDETVEILERNRDVVSFYLSEPDKSEAHAFNKGWRRARGKYLKPITDDDYLYPDAMRKMIETMKAHPEIDVLLAGGERFVLADGKPKPEGFFRIPEGVPAGSVKGFWSNHCGLGLLLKAQALDICGGTTSSMVSVDGDLVSRIIRCGLNYSYLDICLYKWYIHPHSGANKTEAFDSAYVDLRWRLSPVEPFWRNPPGLPTVLRTLYLDDADKGVQATVQLLLWQVRSRRTITSRLIGAILWLLGSFVASCLRLKKLLSTMIKPLRGTPLQAIANHSESIHPWTGELR